MLINKMLPFSYIYCIFRGQQEFIASTVYVSNTLS